MNRSSTVAALQSLWTPVGDDDDDDGDGKEKMIKASSFLDRICA
jgi:hypothetical protein